MHEEKTTKARGGGPSALPLVPLRHAAFDTATFRNAAFRNAAAFVQPGVRTLMWALLWLLAAEAASFVMDAAIAHPAMAQAVKSTPEGGSPSGITNALHGIYASLASWVEYAAGIGLLVSCVIWATSGGSQTRKSLGLGGMACAVGAYLIAAIAPDLLAQAASWAGGSK